MDAVVTRSARADPLGVQRPGWQEWAIHAGRQWWKRGAMARNQPEYIEPGDGQDPDGHETVDEDRGTDAETEGGDDGS